MLACLLFKQIVRRVSKERMIIREISLHAPKSRHTGVRPKKMGRAQME